jgi:hypothetical protein
MAICVLAAAATLIVGFTGCDWSILTPGDAWVVPIVLAPYVLLGLLAWWRRESRAASVLVLVAVLVLAGAGLGLFGLDAYGRATDPRYGMAMHFQVVGVPALQGLGVLVLGLALLAGRAVGRLRTRRG